MASPNANLSISDAGLQALKEREGFRDKPYLDTAGVWTIGHGTTMIDGVKVTKDTVATKEQLDQIFKDQLETYQQAVRDKITKPLTQGQFDALTSFAYNTGTGNLDGDVGKYINSGEASKVPNAMMQYIGVSPSFPVGNSKIKITVPDDGLARRRIDEAHQFDSTADKGDLFDEGFKNAEAMRGRAADKLALVGDSEAEKAARLNRLLDEQYFPPSNTGGNSNMSQAERLPGYRDELENAIRKDQANFEKEWEKLGKLYDKKPEFKEPDVADVEQRIRDQGEWPSGDITPGKNYCPVPGTEDGPLFTPVSGATPASPLVPTSFQASPLSSNDEPQGVLLAANLPLSGFSADGMSYSDLDAAMARELLGAAVGNGRGGIGGGAGMESTNGGQSMEELESEAEDQAGQADSHADRAEAAARRARSAARRAAAAAARLRAMISRRGR